MRRGFESGHDAQDVFVEAERLRAAKAGWIVEPGEFLEDFSCALFLGVQIVIDSREGGLIGFHCVWPAFLNSCAY